MIITKLQGGLGNQMFQYATGRNLATLNQAELKLDLHFLNDKTPRAHFTIRNYELNAFNINEKIADDREVSLFYKFDIYSRLKKKLGKIRLVSEKGQLFYSDIFDLKGNLYLNGYWQSEKYFLNIRETLLSDFSLRPNFLEQINNDSDLHELQCLIQDSQSVSIHFRRGDYVNDSVTNQFHGTASIDYYEKAITRIKELVTNPHFFLFTDDPDWVMNQKIVKEIPCTLAITSNMHLDMYLMSQCKHNIIANSSFSWWGAWLNQNNNKMVIAPIKWFAKKELNQQTLDLIPKSWIRV